MAPALDTSSPVVVALSTLSTTATALATDAVDILTPALDAKDAIRRHLLDNGDITAIQTGARQPVAAVDGGMTKEKLYAVDLLVAVACASLTPPGRCPDAKVWAQIHPREGDNDRLVAAVMAAQEITALAEAPEGYSRWLDGSTATPLLSVARALGSHSDHVRGEATAAARNLNLVAAVQALAGTHAQDVIALPKADSRSFYADAIAQAIGHHIPGGDRMLALNVLNPGEMLPPRPAVEVIDVRFRVPDEATAEQRDLAQRLDDATEPLRRAGKNGTHIVTYFKPSHGASVTKIELRAPDTASVHTSAQRAAELVNSYCVAGLLEPIPQHQVDLKAKGVSAVTDVYRQQLGTHLPPQHQAALRPVLARNYRSS